MYIFFDVLNFEINFRFFVKPFFYMPENSQDKNVNMVKTKETLKMK